MPGIYHQAVITINMIQGDLKKFLVLFFSLWYNISVGFEILIHVNYLLTYPPNFHSFPWVKSQEIFLLYSLQEVTKISGTKKITIQHTPPHPETTTYREKSQEQCNHNLTPPLPSPLYLSNLPSINRETLGYSH